MTAPTLPDDGPTPDAPAAPPAAGDAEVLRRRLEMAAAAAGVAVWTHHLGSDLVHWDGQMWALHGPGAVLSSPGSERYLRCSVHPDDRDALSQGLGALCRRRCEMLEIDYRILRSDGAMRRVSSRTTLEGDGADATLCGVMIDVTERHAAEAKLREANERVALATRGAGIGTWELVGDSKVVWWDAQMFRLRGLPPSPGALRVEDAYASVHPDDWSMIERAVAAPLPDGQTMNYEFRVRWPDGQVRWIASRSTSLRDDSGQRPRRIGINWDVTDMHASAAEREERRLAQQESQAKSQFLARMSHELRTPLNAVLGFAKLLLADAGAHDTRQVRERAHHILRSGEHLLQLVDETLELSSLESGDLPVQLGPTPVSGVVSDVLAMVSGMAHEAGVRLSATPVELVASADPARLRQALLNLVTNAIKYNRPGGEVRIEAFEREGHVLLRVQDTGRGMTEAQLRHLFEPFNRLGAEREGIEGTGIGLAIMRAAVLHMGGTVQVHSQPGVGTCVEVRLDAAGAVSSSKGTAALLPPPAPCDSSARHDVLYIEDNPVNLLIVAELVGRRADLRFHAATDGLSGVEMARRVRPGLVLVDMQLPDIDGLEVLRRLRADDDTAGLRCVALSANAMPADIQAAMRAGFDAYRTKPLDFAAFMADLDAQFGPGPPMPPPMGVAPRVSPP